MIIATAGHVDHGKTSLVHALTGVNTDRLPEEEARNLTIDLGYAYADLGNGQVIGFVDVPGHQRFVTNMVAGVTGIHAALLVVAADDGVMPQTREHLAILDLLGVKHGVVAVTKADRADATRLAEVQAEIETLLAGSTLAGSTLIATSTKTRHGITELGLALQTLNRCTHSDEAAFRMAIDRSFVIEGAGVILTGLVLSGSARVGDVLSVMPAQIAVTVRSLRAQNTEREIVSTGERSAVQIGGRHAGRGVARRGDWLTAPSSILASRRLDVRLRPARTEVDPLRHEMPVHVHVGAADIPGRLALLDRRKLASGEEAWARITLERQAVTTWGDRLVLRDQSAKRTIAGGWVIDPSGPERGRARPERLLHLKALALNDPAEALRRMLATSGGPIDLAGLAARRGLTYKAAEKAWSKVGTRRFSQQAFDPRHWERWCKGAVDALAAKHASHPDQLGPDAHTVARAIGLPAPVVRLVLAELAAQGRVISAFGVYRLPSHRPLLSPEDQTLWKVVRPLLGDADTPAAVVHQIAENTTFQVREVVDLLRRAAALSMVFRISRNRFLLPETVIRLAHAAEAAGAENPDGFTIQNYRQHAPVGRNLAVEFLEFLDRQRMTRRYGLTRRIMSSCETVFQ